MVISPRWSLFPIDGSRSTFDAIVPDSSVDYANFTMLGLDFGEVAEAIVANEVLAIDRLRGCDSLLNCLNGHNQSLHVLHKQVKLHDGHPLNLLRGWRLILRL